MEKIKVLFFAANPAGTERLDLARELLEVDEEIRYGDYRDHLELVVVPGPRTKDLFRQLNRERPHVVHFSGHGGQGGTLFLEPHDDRAEPPGVGPVRSVRDMKKVAGGEAEADVDGGPDSPGGVLGLAGLLRSCNSGNMRMVVLNACHSRTLADAIAETIDCVVCMEKEISDRAAITFAASFYGALAFGRPVQTAFDQAVARLRAEGTLEDLTPSLVVRTGVDAANLLLLDRGPAQERDSSFPPESTFTVPFPRNPDLVGREEDLEKLHASLTGHPPGEARPCGLIGMGGIGKTQLAVEYAYRHRKAFPGGVFWINAAGPLVEGFASLGCTLRAGLQGGTRDEQVRAAYEELARRPRVLLILDNLREPALLNQAVAPGCIPAALPCAILFSTRRRDLGRCAAMEVAALPEDPALRLLLRYPERRPILDRLHPEHGEARAICQMLGRLPLALEVAGAFLGEWTEIPLAEYRQRLESEGVLATLDDEAAELPPAHLPAIHEAAVAATLNTQWDALQDEAARMLLMVAGQFPEAAIIPSARLGLLAGVPTDDRPGHPSPLARALKRLENACLAEVLLNGRFRLHPLFREFAHAKLPREQASEFRRRCAENFARAYCRYPVLEEHATRRGVDAVQEDLITAAALCPDDRDPRPRLESLLRLVQRESHLLRDPGWARGPVFLAQQVHNRAVVVGLDEVRRGALQRIAELGQLHALLLWRASRESPALIRTLTGHRGPVTSVQFTPDGRQALSGSGDHTLGLWDLQTGRELMTFVGHQGAIEEAVITPDGRHVVSASADWTLKVWERESGRERLTLTGHKGSVTAVAVTPDSEFAVSGSTDGSVRVWDLRVGNQRLFLGHLGAVTSVAVSPDGRLAVSGSADATVRVWELQGGRRQRIMVLSGHEREVTSVAVTPDGRQLVSISYDKTLRTWDLASGLERECLSGEAGWMAAIEILPDGRSFLATSRGQLRRHDLATGRELQGFVGHSGRVNAVAASPDARHALSGADDLTLKLWELQLRPDRGEASGHQGRVSCVAVNPGAACALSASIDGTIKAWDLADGRPRGTIASLDSPVTALAVTARGHVVAGTTHGALKRFHGETGEELRSFQCLEGSILALAVTPDATRVVTGSARFAVSVWDLEAGSQLDCMMGHADRVTAVAVTPDGRHALSASDDRSLFLWDLERGRELLILRGHAARVNSVAITPDGSRAISGSSDCTLRLWDLVTGGSLETLRGHAGRVNSVTLSGDGRQAFSTSEDCTVRVWDVEAGACVLAVPFDSTPTALALAADGAHAVVGDASGNVFGFRMAVSVKQTPS
jgi:WD40 repeat protein